MIEPFCFQQRPILQLVFFNIIRLMISIFFKQICKSALFFLSGSFLYMSAARAAKCTFAAGGIEGKSAFGVVSAMARAAKMKTACKRAKKRCDKRLQRLRRKGKVPGGRTTQCTRL